MNRTSMMCSTSSSSPIYIEVVFPKEEKKNIYIYMFVYICIYVYTCMYLYLQML